MSVPYQALCASDGHLLKPGGIALGFRPATEGNPGRLMAMGPCYGTCEGIVIFLFT